MKKLIAIALLFAAQYGMAAMNNFTPVMFVPPLPTTHSGAPTRTSFATINAVDEKVAAIIRIPKTGNVRKLAFRFNGADTGFGQNVRLETVGATGNPTGTLMCTNSTGTIATASSVGSWLTSSAFLVDCAVTRGTYAAIVVVATDTVNVQWGSFDDSFSNFPYYVSSTSVSGYTKAAATGVGVGLEYDDGTYPYIEGNIPFSTLTNVFTGSGDSIGNRIRFPVDTVVTGAWVWADIDGDVAMVLYGSNDAIILSTATLDLDYRAANGSDLHYVNFDSSFTLSAGTFYRVAMKALSATTNTIVRFDSNSQAAYDGLSSFGNNFYATSANNPTGTGSWTDATMQQYPVGVIISGINGAAGGGGSSAMPFVR